MGNIVDPTVIIRGDVEMGDGNEILPYTVLIGPLVVGNGNWIGPHVTIGTPGQDTRNPRYDAARGRIEIGSGNIIREYTAIQKPLYRERTCIGNGVFLMHGVHVPHDALIEDDVVISSMAALGGMATVMEGASLGMACSVQQRVVIGPYAFVGMASAVARNVKPFARHVPAPVSVNGYALKKFGFEASKEEIADYVLRGKRPRTPHLLTLIERFDRFDRESAS